MKRFTLVALSFLVVLFVCVVPAAAQCTVAKTWGVHEILQSTDINAGFTRTVTANVATCTTGYSATVSQMKVTTDPYPGGTESLASTVADELGRVRFQLNAVAGKSFWYQPIDNSLASSVSKHWGATWTGYFMIATPTPLPTNGTLQLYAKNDGTGKAILAYQDTNGTETLLTGASSSSGSGLTINYKAARNAISPTTKLDLSSDRISVAGFIKTSFSVTVDFTTTGANALDAGVLAASTKYYIWVVYNPAANSFAGLGSTSETAPAMPSGYTLKRLIGMWRTDVATAFQDGQQLDNIFSYAQPQPVLVAGTTSSPAVSVDLSAHAPVLTLRKIHLSAQIPSGEITYLHWQSFNPVAVQSAWASIATNTASGIFYAQVSIPTNNPTRPTIFYGKTAGGTLYLWTVGWEMQWRD
jgi:hypothetical protein